MRMRNTWVEVNLDHIVHNLQEARKLLPTDTKIAAVLKANAYGHGAVQVSRLLVDNRVDQLAVACLSEALELRRYHDDIPILIMGYTPDEYLETAIINRITLTVSDILQAQKISDLAVHLCETAKIHIKIDTGFNRLGLKPGAETISTIEKIYRMKNIDLEGIFTHLALKTQMTDLEQFSLFADMTGKLEDCGIHIPIKHVNDSIGMVRYPCFDLDMVRIGAFIYGIPPTEMNKEAAELKLAMTFKTQITRIEEIYKGDGVGYDYEFVARGKCRVGTLAAGYADGYMRCLSGKGEVSIRGKRAPVIGKICMDQCMVDLTGIPEAQRGDEAVLMGEAAEDCIPVMEVAEKAGTNRNELISMISRRVPRVYIHDSGVTAVVDYILD